MNCKDFCNFCNQVDTFHTDVIKSANEWTYICCTCSCGKTETREIAATGHPDADGNKICDACGHDWNEYEEEDNSFFGKIKAFFQKIIDWFKNLFKF